MGKKNLQGNIIVPAANGFVDVEAESANQPIEISLDSIRAVKIPDTIGLEAANNMGKDKMLSVLSPGQVLVEPTHDSLYPKGKYRNELAENDDESRWDRILKGPHGGLFMRELCELNKSLIDEILTKALPSDKIDQWKDEKYDKFWGFVFSRMVARHNIGVKMDAGEVAEDENLATNRNMVTTFIFNIDPLDSGEGHEFINKDILNEAILIYQVLGEEELIPKSKQTLIITSEAEAFPKHEDRKNAATEDVNDVARNLQQLRYRQVVEALSIRDGPWGDIIWIESPGVEPKRGWDSALSTYIVKELSNRYVNNSLSAELKEIRLSVPPEDLEIRINMARDLFNIEDPNDYIIQTGNVFLCRDEEGYYLKLDGKIEEDKYIDSSGIVEALNLKAFEDGSLNTLSVIRSFIRYYQYIWVRDSIKFYGEGRTAQKISLGFDRYGGSRSPISAELLTKLYSRFEEVGDIIPGLNQTEVKLMMESLLIASKMESRHEDKSVMQMAQRIALSIENLPISTSLNKTIGERLKDKWVLWGLNEEYEGLWNPFRRVIGQSLLAAKNEDVHMIVNIASSTVIEHESVSASFLNVLLKEEKYSVGRGERVSAITTLLKVDLNVDATNRLAAAMAYVEGGFQFGVGLERIIATEGVTPISIKVILTQVGIDGEIYYKHLDIPLTPQKCDDLQRSGFFSKLLKGQINELMPVARLLMYVEKPIGARVTY